MGWVLDKSEAQGNARLVLLSIANHTGEFGLSWPSYTLIAHESRCDRRTAIRAVQELVDLGDLVIVEHGGPHRSNRYLIPAIGGDNLTLSDSPVVTSRHLVVTSDPVSSDTGVTRTISNHQQPRTRAHARDVDFAPGSGRLPNWSKGQA